MLLIMINKKVLLKMFQITEESFRLNFRGSYPQVGETPISVCSKVRRVSSKMDEFSKCDRRL